MSTYTPNHNLSVPENTDSMDDFFTNYAGNLVIIDEKLMDWTQLQHSGTKIATIVVNGQTVDVYAPNGGGGGGNVNDVLVNGTSVVDGNGDAQIVSYKEVTQVQYDALPSSKLTDGIAYFIKDAVTPQYASEDLIAPVLSTFFATNDINTKGQQFIYNGTLYEITTTVTSGTAFIVGTNVQEADSVTEQITKGWTLVGSKTGENSLALPSNFRELYVTMKIDGNVSYTVAFHIIREVLSATETVFRGGGYVNTSAQYGCGVGVTLTNIRSRGAYRNTTNYTATSVMDVYYK